MSEPSDNTVLSSYTNALLRSLTLIKKEIKPPDTTFITVSHTVSFFAILYEKVRNAVEFREEHLIRRAAIERIIKRRLLLNPDGHGEGENLARELLWARYLAPSSITEKEVLFMQTIINQLIALKKIIGDRHQSNSRALLIRYLIDFITCEIEEELHKDSTERKSAYLYFLYQVLKNKITIKNTSDTVKDTYFYVACEAGFAKNDLSYTRYHLFRLAHKSIANNTPEELKNLASHFSQIAHYIEKTIANPYHQKLTKFVRKQAPAFSILFSIMAQHPQDLSDLLSNKAELWKKTDSICREKYNAIGEKLRRAAIRSVIYIFLTKMLFILLRLCQGLCMRWEMM